MAAIIPAVVSAVGSVASSLIGAKSAKDAQKRAMNDPLAIAQREQITQQTQYGREMADLARKLFPKYESGINELTDFYKSVLGDDNGVALEAIAPLVRNRKMQTQAALNRADFMPRGGGRNSEIGRLYDTEASDLYDLLTTQRNTARNNYASLIGDIGARGQGLYGQASQNATNAASLLGMQADRSIQAGEAARARTGQLVQGIGQAISPLLVDLIRGGSNREDESGATGRPSTPMGFQNFFNPRP
jgi:hypothetical protein